jgi:signal transduction histidine kinase
MADDGWLARSYLEQSPALHWIVTREGAFHEIWGDATPVFGKSTVDLLGCRPAQLWITRFERALAGETLLLRERFGPSTWYISVFPIQREGSVEFVGGLAREISPWSTAEQELRYTVLSALKAQEFDRKMASQFLHDSVGQNLTALGFQLDLIRMDLEQTAPAIGGRIVEIQKMLETMMEQVREYSYELNPSTVERAGLRAALDRLAARIHARFAGTLRVNADPSLKLDPRIASAFYHIAQEAVENSVQHSSCSVIEIAVKSTRSGPILEVRDNGRGFDPGDIPGVRRGLGLLSMEHYAAQAGLQLSIASNRNTGTAVRVSKPEAV